MRQGVLEGVLQIVGVIAVAAGVISAVLNWRAVARVLLGTGRRLHVVPEPPPTPLGRPIERIAADARRLRFQLRQVPPGLPVARLQGWRQAYDDVLVEGCRALGIEDLLSDLPPGTERESERLRVEYLLENAGLGFRNAS
jgi:hypothetical protein